MTQDSCESFETLQSPNRRLETRDSVQKRDTNRFLDAGADADRARHVPAAFSGACSGWGREDLSQASVKDVSASEDAFERERETGRSRRAPDDSISAEIARPIRAIDACSTETNRT